MRPAGCLVLRSICVRVMGLDRANAFKENSHSFRKTACLKSSVCFPLWSGLSEPSQPHSPLGSLNGNHFELPRGSDARPQPGCHGAPGGTSGPGGAGWHLGLIGARLSGGPLPGRRGGLGAGPWRHLPAALGSGRGCSWLSGAPVPGSRHRQTQQASHEAETGEWDTTLHLPHFFSFPFVFMANC